MKSILSKRLPRGASALIVGLPLALCASTAHAAIMCSDNFEGGGNCGTWSPQMSSLTSEWSVNSTSETGNAFYERVDGSGTTGAWNDSMNGNSYSDVTVSSHMRVNSWNGTGNDQATMYVRYNPANQGGISWYSVSLTSDGWIHIRRNNQGTVTNLLDLNNIGVQPGRWFNLRVEAIGSDPAVALNVYLDGAWQGSYIDTNAVSMLRTGYMAFGGFGVDMDVDDVIVGDVNDTLAPAYDANWNVTNCSAATGQPHICQESGQVSRLELKGQHPWWMGKAHAGPDMWAMNYGFDVFGKADAKRGL